VKTEILIPGDFDSARRCFGRDDIKAGRTRAQLGSTHVTIYRYERFLPKNFSFSGKNFVSTLLDSNSRLLTFDLYFACLDYWNI
jgi:hypothetical protein